MRTENKPMAQIGRNDLCPCGSGLKYKKCCLGKPGLPSIPGDPGAGVAVVSEPHRPAGIAASLDTAYRYHVSGRLAEAEAGYRRVLAVDPENFDALHLLGMLSHQNARNEEAAELISSAVQKNGRDPVALGNLAIVLRAMGRLAEAEAACRRAIALDPGFVDAHKILGSTLQDLGQSDDAETAFRRAIALNANDFGAHGSLGTLLMDRGSFDQAAAAFRAAAALRPDSAETFSNLGNALYHQGNMEEAEAACRAALKIKPDCAEAFNNLGNVLRKTFRPEEAEETYRQAIRLRPDYVEAFSNLGNLLFNQDRQDEAETNCLRAIALDGEFNAAHANLSNVLSAQGRLHEAEACCRKALELQPDNAASHGNMGNIINRLGRCDEAEFFFRRALELQSDYALANSNFLFALNYGFMDAASLFREHRLWSKRHCPAPADRIEWARIERALEQADPKPRIRIGFVSADFGLHPVGFFLLPYLAHHDRGRFEIYCYSDRANEDGMTLKLKSNADVWRHTIGMKDDALAKGIAIDNIDILVDLAGHTASNRLQMFALKPAPVQVTWLGYANTTGLDAIDYILADPITIPPDEEPFYTEKVRRLPETYICFAPPEEDVAITALPASVNGHITFGCFNNPAKLNNRVIACWADILRATPDSVLLLKYKPFGHESVQEDFRARFSAFGIEPDRLRFNGHSTHDAYLATYGEVDIALDPFPFPGLTTTCEALWMGVPVLTMRMPRGIYGHNGELVMKSIGLPEWVADSAEEYVAKALDFAGNTGHLALLRQSLRSAFIDSPLCNAERFARHLESAFQGMLEENIAGDSAMSVYGLPPFCKGFFT
jgi:predicted O-linked N-acetylglucosamine transferase (SPINDLY family)